MESRTEPRFETNSAAIIEVVRDKAYTFKGRITNVSGLGFQIEMAEPLTPGETIQLTIDGYQMLTEVRRCVRFGSAFAVGVERVDHWEGTTSEGAMMSEIVSRALPVLGRPALKKPVGSLRAAALRGLFADPRLRTRQAKYSGVFLFAGSVALAGWAVGFAGWGSAGQRLLATAAPKVEAAKKLPVRPTSPVNATPATVEKPSVISTDIRTDVGTNIPTEISKGIGTGTAAAIETTPAVRQARVETPSNPTASSAASSVHSISIKASTISWVTACADGAKVFDKLFKEGDAGVVRFAHEATVRSGNAGALELAVGNQSIGSMGALGAIRTIKATPAGYEFISPKSGISCNVEQTSAGAL